MSDVLKYKGYTGSVEYSEADNLLCGQVLGIRSLILCDGETLEDLKKSFEYMVDDYLEVCKEEGIEPEKPYKGTFNVRVSPELHRDLAVYAMSHNQSLNSTVEEAIRQYVR